MTGLAEVQGGGGLLAARHCTAAAAGRAIQNTSPVIDLWSLCQVERYTKLIACACYTLDLPAIKSSTSWCDYARPLDDIIGINAPGHVSQASVWLIIRTIHMCSTPSIASSGPILLAEYYYYFVQFCYVESVLEDIALNI